MNTFVEVLSFVGAIVLGVVALALFFTVALGRIKAYFAPPLALARLLAAPLSGGPVRVGMKDGSTIEAACIVGGLDSDQAADAGLPYGLRDWLVLERDDGTRIWIKPEGIRWIERQAAHAPTGEPNGKPTGKPDGEPNCDPNGGD